MSSHAFDVLAKSRTGVEIVHHEEGHRYKFGVVTNASGKRVLADSVEVTASAASKRAPEFFSGSARAFATSIAHRIHAID
jgi:hypothetical protein